MIYEENCSEIDKHVDFILCNKNDSKLIKSLLIEIYNLGRANMYVDILHNEIDKIDTELKKLKEGRNNENL